MRYTPAHVRAQIHAVEEQGVRGWILWNAQNHYSWSAIQAGPIVKPEAETPVKAAKSPKKSRQEPKAAVEAVESAPAPLPAMPPAEPKTPDATSDAFGPSPEAPPTPETK